MENRRRKVAAILLTVLVLLMFALANVSAISFAAASGSMDLFTQKVPYDGRGWHVNGDSFGPDEVVILYAFVVCNSEPCQNLPVAFHIVLPSSESFVLSAQTNSTGFAVVDFAVMTPPVDANESDVFGVWSAFAETRTAGLILEDSLSFEVGWIVKLLSVRTVDANLSYRAYFGRGGEVGLEVVLRNLAMVAKNITIAVTVKDELGTPTNFFEVEGFEIQPDQKLVSVYFKFRIPTYASTGNGTVFVSALSYQQNESGYPYCPGISTSFYVTTYDPATIVFHDASVISVYASSSWVELGQPINVYVAVRNEGTEVESFLVKMYFGDIFGGSQMVSELPPYAKQVLSFDVDTAAFGVGNYTLSAFVHALVGEADLSDNVLVGDEIEIGLHGPLVVHDVTIVNVTVSNSSVYVGEVIQVFVGVANMGTGLETFNVSVSFGISTIGLDQVDSLMPGAYLTLLFLWDTTGVETGLYQVVATAHLPDDVNVYDNTYVGGFVQISSLPQPSPVHDVTVLDVVPLRSLVYVGEIIQIDVRVKNKGNTAESFNVLLLCNGSVRMILHVGSLDAGSEYLLSFGWDTSGAIKGTYTVSAYAEAVEGEDSVSDNLFANGSVKVVDPPAGLVDLDWYGVLLLLLLVILLALLLSWFYYRSRSSKRSRDAISSGWIAWYYRRDLPYRSSKNRKNDSVFSLEKL